MELIEVQRRDGYEPAAPSEESMFERELEEMEMGRKPRKRGIVHARPLALILGLAGVLVVIVILALFSKRTEPHVDTDSMKTQGAPLRFRDVPSSGAHLPGNLIWADGLRFLRQSRDGSIVMQEMGKSYDEYEILAPASELVDDSKKFIPFNSFYTTEDLKRVVLRLNEENRWRHSLLADYYYYDVALKRSIKLGTGQSGKISLVVTSPESHEIAFVSDNNIYWATDEDQVQITKDGSDDILNGVSDWVYEEEVFASPQAMWFSPHGQFLAFIKFREQGVPEYKMNLYERPRAQYPEQIGIKYPKAGAGNPVAELYIAKKMNPQNVTRIDFPTNYLEKDQVITQVTWISPSSLLIRIMNRVQDSQKVYFVSQHDGSWTTELVRNEATKDKAWYAHLQPLEPISSSDERYLELLEDEKGYSHIALFHRPVDKEPAKMLTSGEFDVTEIRCVDSKQEMIYFSSTEHGSTQRHVFRMSFLGGSKELLLPNTAKSFDHQVPNFEGELLDAQEPRLGNVTLGYYKAVFSPGCQYMLLTYGGPDVPFTVGMHMNSRTEVMLEDNKALRTRLGLFEMPKSKFLLIPNGDGHQMNAKLLLPYNFDASKKYPVLMHTYGGPGSQTVNMEYDVTWMHALANEGWIVMFSDGRGTGYRGRQWMASISKQLGVLETRDQLAAATWISRLPFVDHAHIAFFGWSFGGYLACKLLEANTGLIKLSLAVAPVTDWIFYDSIYTERYLKTPEENPNGYEKSAVTSMEGFQKAHLFLAHGTADDNVHIQNTFDLLWKLQEAGVHSYDVHIFPDSDHSIRKGNARLELDALLLEQLSQFLKN